MSSTSGDLGSRRFSSRRTALFLYVVLVGLPAVVFGALLFRQLSQDQNRMMAEQPAECLDAANRLGELAAGRVRSLLNVETQRPFWEYRPTFFEDNLGPILPVVSPLTSEPLPDGIVGWFSFQVGIVSGQPHVDVLRGRGAPQGPDPIANRIRELVRTKVAGPLLSDSIVADDELRRAQEDEGHADQLRPLLRTVVLNLSTGSADECAAALEQDETLQSRDREDGRDRHNVYAQPIKLRVLEREGQDYPAIIGLRSISIPSIADGPSLPSCIDTVERTVHLVQGFVVDTRWIFETMPVDVANHVLSIDMELILANRSAPVARETTVAEVDFSGQLSDRLDLNSATLPNVLRVRADASTLHRTFRVQNAWFGGMAFILTISMGIGIRLLLSSIRASRIETERTRNFVASVTHELRTPIAAVKLYGEMLHDGWVQGEEKRTEYLARIVHESDRLDALVDRVLLRRKLFDRNHNPHPGDLNEEILRQQEDLEMVGGRAAGDIAFDLSPGLPHVLVLPDGIHVIVQNLVENARKYAPVGSSPEGTPDEPILVRTRMSQKGHVLLEVLDRGPGIPEKDRSRVFEAFLRLGEESTRTTKGTGLGLHLVALQARAMKGKVRALPRSGGGTVFQVQLKRG